MQERYCQSCGMPMGETNEFYGTEKDGTRSKDYCKFCFADGAFTAECTMDEMIDFCVGPMLENSSGMDESTARNIMQNMFPRLKRWQSK